MLAAGRRGTYGSFQAWRGDRRTRLCGALLKSKIFGYAFSRLLISFGLITVLFIAILMLLFSLLGIDPKNPGPLSLALPVVGAIVTGYQIVMTSVVLSRSYLRVRPPAAPVRRMAFVVSR